MRFGYGDCVQARVVRLGDREPAPGLDTDDARNATCATEFRDAGGLTLRDGCRADTVLHLFLRSRDILRLVLRLSAKREKSSH